jgi:hypothetical protein
LEEIRKKIVEEKIKEEEKEKINKLGNTKSEKIDIIFTQVSIPYKYYQNIKIELLEIFNNNPTSTLEPKLGSLGKFFFFFI